MCSPGLQILGSVVGAIGQMRQQAAEASAIKAQAAQNQAIAEYNAKLSEQNAEINRKAGEDSIVRGTSDAALQRENARKANARGRAITGSAGLLTDTGSALKLQLENTATGELNALTAMNNAEREAYCYKISETSDLAQAESLRYQGRVGVAYAKYEAKVKSGAGLLGSGTTLVSGAIDYGKGGGFFNTAPKTKDIYGRTVGTYHTKR